MLSSLPWRTIKDGLREAVVVPTPGDGASETVGEIRVPETGLLELSSLSLEDLSCLDESVVANAIRDLVKRRRCGTGPRERFNDFKSAI